MRRVFFRLNQALTHTPPVVSLGAFATVPNQWRAQALSFDANQFEQQEKIPFMPQGLGAVDISPQTRCPAVYPQTLWMPWLDHGTSAFSSNSQPPAGSYPKKEVIDSELISAPPLETGDAQARATVPMVSPIIEVNKILEAVKELPVAQDEEEEALDVEEEKEEDASEEETPVVEEIGEIVPGWKKLWEQSKLSDYGKPIDETLTCVEDNPLNVYLKCLNALNHYIASPMDKAIIAKKTKAYVELARETQVIVQKISETDSPKPNLQMMQKKLKALSQFLDGIDALTLEGQKTDKSGRCLNRGVFNAICYHLASFFRAFFNLLTYVLTLGQFSHRNVLAEKMGFGRFFIQKPMIEAEKNHIKSEKASLNMLLRKLENASTALNEIAQILTPADLAENNPLPVNAI